MKLAEDLDSLLPEGEERRFGELLLGRSMGEFSARHRDDAPGYAPGDAALERIDSVPDLREMAKFDAGGAYRPLRTAPTLRRGWFTATADPGEFLRRLDAIYPGVFATWAAYDRGELDPVPLRETLERQTGMYRFAGSISDAMANRIMRDLCGKGCLRQIAWPIDSRCPVSRLTRHPRVIPMICTEACTFAVSEARRLAREAYDRDNAPG